MALVHRLESDTCVLEGCAHLFDAEYPSTAELSSCFIESWPSNEGFVSYKIAKILRMNYESVQWRDRLDSNSSSWDYSVIKYSTSWIKNYCNKTLNVFDGVCYSWNLMHGRYLAWHGRPMPSCTIPVTARPHPICRSFYFAPYIINVTRVDHVFIVWIHQLMTNVFTWVVTIMTLLAAFEFR